MRRARSNSPRSSLAVHEPALGKRFPKRVKRALDDDELADSLRSTPCRHSNMLLNRDRCIKGGR